MSEPTVRMKLRRVTLQLSMWEDAAAFGYDSREILNAAMSAFPSGTMFGVENDSINIYDVATQAENS